MGAAANSAGPTTTFAPMPFPDDPDDEAGFIPPLPQDDRLWRHPSEMAGPKTPPAPPHRRRTSRSGVAAFIVLGLIVTTTGLAAIATLTANSNSQRTTPFAVGPAASELPETALASIAPAVVQISIDRATNTSVVTGLMIRSDGHVLTTSDSLEGARSITVTTSDGRAFNAKVVGTDPADDLAVIDIEGAGLPTPTFGDANSVTQGSTVYVISRTTSDSRSWVATATFQAVGMRLDATDGSSLHDMIGAAISTQPPTASAVLCTQAGEVIGVLTSRVANTTRSAEFASAPSTLALPNSTNSFAHSVEWARHVADDLIDTGTVHHAWLGVLTTDSPEGGAFIQSVTSKSPAEKADLRPEDRVVSVSGHAIRTSSDLIVALRHYSANDKVTIDIVRNGQTVSKSATLSVRT